MSTWAEAKLYKHEATPFTVPIHLFQCRIMQQQPPLPPWRPRRQLLNGVQRRQAVRRAASIKAHVDQIDGLVCWQAQMRERGQQRAVQATTEKHQHPRWQLELLACGR